MLHIFIDGSQEISTEYEGKTSAYFDDVFEQEWFEDDFVKRIIHDIDNTEVVDGFHLYNEVLGNIPPQYLSTGCKTLILIHKESIKVNGDRLGDNCIDLLLEMASQKDVYILLTHIPKTFPENLTAIITNNQKLITSYYEFITEYVRWIYG